MVMEVLSDCFCESYLQDIKDFPKKKFKEKNLKKGEQVEFIKEWVNDLGRYYTIEFKKIQYDINPIHLKKVGLLKE